MTNLKRGTFDGLLTIALRSRRYGRGLPAIALGVLIAPMQLASPNRAMAQMNVDVSNGNSIQIGQKQGNASQQHEIRVPTLGHAFDLDESSKAFIFASREYEKRIRRIRFRYFAGGKIKHEPTRERGFQELSSLTEPAALLPMIEVLHDEDPIVRDWMLDHLKYDAEEPYGQAALTWLSIYDEDEDMREGARLRLTGDANPRSQFVIDQALRLPNNDVVNHAALAAGRFKLVEAIPLLIATQAASSAAASTSGTGALAFIQVQTQRFFISDLQPVVGTNSAGFDPQLSPISEGSLMIIQDAVVEFYRMDVHDTLLDLVRQDYGESVDYGFNYNDWKNWYNTRYLPYKRAQLSSSGDAHGADNTGRGGG